MLMLAHAHLSASDPSASLRVLDAFGAAVAAGGPPAADTSFVEADQDRPRTDTRNAAATNDEQAIHSFLRVQALLALGRMQVVLLNPVMQVNV